MTLNHYTPPEPGHQRTPESTAPEPGGRSVQGRQKPFHRTFLRLIHLKARETRVLSWSEKREVDSALWGKVAIPIFATGEFRPHKYLQTNSLCEARKRACSFEGPTDPNRARRLQDAVDRGRRMATLNRTCPHVIHNELRSMAWLPRARTTAFQQAGQPPQRAAESPGQ